MDAMKDPRVAALTEKIRRRQEVRDEARATAKDYRDQVDQLDSEIRLLAEEIETGQKTLFGDVPDAAGLEPSEPPAAAAKAPRGPLARARRRA